MTSEQIILVFYSTNIYLFLFGCINNSNFLLSYFRIILTRLILNVTNTVFPENKK